MPTLDQLAAAVAIGGRREHFQRVIQLPTPAVGAELSFTPAGGVIYIVRSIQLRFVASAVVANRQLALLVNSQDGGYFRCILNGNITAGQSVFVNWFDGAVFNNLGGRFTAPLLRGGLLLMPGFTLATATIGLDVGDQISTVTALVEDVSTADWPVEFQRQLAALQSLVGPGEPSLSGRPQ